MLGLPVIRPESVEMSVWGVASLAGLEEGVWQSRAQLDTIRGRGTTFTRSSQQEEDRDVMEEYRKWLDACNRFTKWYQD